MQLVDIVDEISAETVFIVGTGPTAKFFSREYFKDKTCIFLNNAYKSFESSRQLAILHSIDYLYDANSFMQLLPYAGAERLAYPIVKVSKALFDRVAHKSLPFYFYYFSHDLEKYDPKVITNEIFYQRDGSSLHAGLQIANLIGAKHIIICGCDAKTFADNHYGLTVGDKFRTEERLDRDYEAYTKGCIAIVKKLRRSGVNVFNLSGLIGYDSLELQYREFIEEIDDEIL